MRSLLTVVMCALLLAGCGDDVEPELGAPPEVVRIMTQTAGGGRVAKQATALPDDSAVEHYVAGFEGALAGQVRAAVDSNRTPEHTLYAQVVAVGCDVPSGARVDVVQKVVITPDPVRSPKQECFAPVTTVVLASVPVD